MDDLKFDIYALVKPKTKEDYIALLDEALLILDDLNDLIDQIFNLGET